MEINSDYIEKNLIAYIGNKRRLIDLILKSIESTKINNKKNNIKFLDLFAGTGVVSRLAKNLGFEVSTNDWELYSYVINKAFIELDNEFLEHSFNKLGGFKHVIDILNSLSDLKQCDKYISLFYCPDNDDNPDLENDRMFYTAFNGKKIDMIRAKINDWKNNELIDDKEENLLLALLIYEASTRSNTSGVFKGFHKGFGGTNQDALSRIMKKLELNYPSLINGKKCTVYNKDAVELSETLKDEDFDIVYLDPPYNQHQYGSNYHLLNTIALNDKPTVNKNVIIDGKKINKSAIRKDWIKTRSTFCYKDSAKNDFHKIIKNLNTNYILISYSTDGLINFDEMLEMLSEKGKLEIVLSEYVKYRGGKQSLTTEVNNIEFILIVNTKESGNLNDIINIKKKLSYEKILMLLKKTMNPYFALNLGYELDTNVLSNEISLRKKYDNYEIFLNLLNNKVLTTNINDIIEVSPDNITENILSDLDYLTNITKDDELHLQLNEILKLNSYNNAHHDISIDLFKNIPYLLSKYNNKKAYVSSLKAIIDILVVLNDKKDLFKKNNFIESTSFNKFEKILLLKLNYDYEIFDEVDELKTEISKLYEMFIKFSEIKYSKNNISNIASNYSEPLLH